MKKIIKVVGAVSIIGMLGVAPQCSVSAYTTDSITSWPTYGSYVDPEDLEPTLHISIRPKVGSSTLSAPDGATDTANYYVPVSIAASNVSKYFVSAYLDCTDSSNITACNRGELLGNGTDTIPPVGSSKTLDSMSNEWGFRYNIGSAASKPTDKYFTAMPTSRDAGWIRNSDGGTAFSGIDRVLTLDFGAAISSSVPGGTYAGRAVVAVVANPLEAITMGDITYFQQMTSEICKSTPKDQEYALQDTRDLKIYKVAKLADNNCWMIQNLAIDSGETEQTRRQLNSTSSDLADGTTYLLPVDDKSSGGRVLLNRTHVDDKYDNYPLDEGQALKGYGDGSGDNMGGQYNWSIAVADSLSTSETSGDAPYSICPKGWQLPSEGQFQALLNEYYDADRTVKVANFSAAWRSGYTGQYNPGGVGLYWHGQYDEVWARTVKNAGYSVTLYAGVTDTVVSQYSKGGCGIIRCVAK